MTEQNYKLGVRLAELTAEAVSITEDASPLLVSIETISKKNPALKSGFLVTIADYIATGFAESSSA